MYFSSNTAYSPFLNKQIIKTKYVNIIFNHSQIQPHKVYVKAPLRVKALVQFISPKISRLGLELGTGSNIGDHKLETS